jgi:diaminopropionate ammonia-lyase
VLSGELRRRGLALEARSVIWPKGGYRSATEALVVTCATDGNHGRAVAWGARRFRGW